jgi:hypothetical protein
VRIRLCHSSDCPRWACCIESSRGPGASRSSPSSAKHAADRVPQGFVGGKRVDFGPVAPVSRDDLRSHGHLNAQRNSALRWTGSGAVQRATRQRPMEPADPLRCHRESDGTVALSDRAPQSPQIFLSAVPTGPSGHSSRSEPCERGPQRVVDVPAPKDLRRDGRGIAQCNSAVRSYAWESVRFRRPGVGVRTTSRHVQ